MNDAPAIKILRPGSFTSVEGTKVSFTVADLAQIAASYKPDADPAPIVVGHPKMADPAFGWVGSLELQGDVLVAKPSEIAPSLAEAVKAGHYRKISAQLYQPGDANSPDPSGWYLRHVGFLGAAAPAIKGLGQVSLGDGAGAITISLAETDLARALNAAIDRRDAPRAETIAKMAEAAGIDPGTVNEILNGDIATPPDRRLRGFARVLGLSFDTLKSLTPKSEISMSEGSTISLSEHESALAKKDAELQAAREEAAKVRREAMHSAHVSFVEVATKAGRVAPAAAATLVGLLDALAPLEPVSFAEGEKAVSPVDALKALIESATPLISFGEAAPADKKAPGKAPVSFAAPAGYDVEPAAAALHARAKTIQAENPKLDWFAAVERARAAA